MAGCSILITGATGLLGNGLLQEWHKTHTVYATGRRSDQESRWPYLSCDLTKDNIEELIEWSDPEVIVHCAALTSVEYCENHPEEAHAVNSEATRRLALCVGKRRLIYISTAGVLATHGAPATEKDPIGPSSMYARSKWIGEQHTLQLAENAVVVRTTPVGFSPGKRGFVDWMVSRLEGGEQVPLFSDVYFSPIAIADLAKRLEWFFTCSPRSVYHVAGGERATRESFGRRLCRSLGFSEKLLVPALRGGTDETLSSAKFLADSGWKPPSVEHTLTALTTHYRHSVRQIAKR